MKPLSNLQKFTLRGPRERELPTSTKLKTTKKNYNAPPLVAKKIKEEGVGLKGGFKP